MIGSETVLTRGMKKKWLERREELSTTKNSLFDKNS